MTSKYQPTIGLEIHAELSTQTKMFCNSKNDPDEKTPNANICPICLGHPGTLPVINKEAVRHVLKVGLAVNGELADFTEFDRKNYFYPDIPKGYQISQYKFPLVKGGSLNGIGLTRIHLEEDTATSKHDQGDFSVIDFNRAGVPLMELVTEPVIHSAKEASDFAKELQLLLQHIGVAEANMEKGEMRVEANISISDDSKKFGTKVEVKNLNSFRSVERAIAFEINRMTELLEKGEKVVQETRGWNEGKQKTFSQREKEESHDYRYFPDPDLPKLYVSEVPEFQKDVLKKEIPELPWERREKYQTKFGLKAEDADQLVRYIVLGSFFEEVTKDLNDPKEIVLASNYITSDLAGLSKSSGDLGKISAGNFASLIKMIAAREVSSRAAKDLLAQMFQGGGEARHLAESAGLLQKSDPEALKSILSKILSDNAQVVADYKNGKQSAFQYFVGQAMKETKGSADPEKISQILSEMLSRNQ